MLRQQHVMQGVKERPVWMTREAFPAGPQNHPAPAGTEAEPGCDEAWPHSRAGGANHRADSQRAQKQC